MIGGGARRASALIMALWTIAVLSIMALAFAVEAHLQAGVNLYVRERSHVNRLTEAGKVLAEVVLTGYSDVSRWSEDEDFEQLFEDDRWIREKRALKTDSACTIGPIALDDEHPENGTVKIEIKLVTGGETLNLNDLYPGGDKNYRERLQMILQNHGIDEDFEVKDEDGKSVNMQDWLIACWVDWRDDDDTVGTVGEAKGAEKTWYIEYAEDERVDDEDRYVPRNGPVPDVQELEHVRGFRNYPAVLTGGLVYPDEKEDEVENPRLTGILGIFGTTGSTKVNANTASLQLLMTVPGIFDVDDPEESEIVAQAIIDARKEMPDRSGVDPDRGEWPFTDFADLQNRCEEQIGTEASEYLVYGPQSTDIFEVKITGESMGMTREISARCYLSDKNVRYIEWRED